ncbi:MAG: acyl-CoA synthetase FdrA [Rhodospirillales bacterium]|nr:acyl-CoA synthetase FdrA [Rhodospirillales bacterium]
MHTVVANLYRDSVSLMQLSAALGKRPGVAQASAVMATPANLELLREAGLMDAAVKPSPNDLLVAVRGEPAAALKAALAAALEALEKPPARAAGDGPAAQPLRSLQMGLAHAPEANLALISVPGEYAAAEAMKALRLGLNVMLFSDNVPLAAEVALKRFARSRDLLLMGPDCGTAIVDGIPLGFANAVRRGAIGVVGASGTGTQQVTSLVHRRGAGISQAIGTGGHDLHQEVGGITLLHGLKLLARDPETRVIVLISKPPAPAVAKKVLDAARRVGKPVVVNFVGAAQNAAEGKLFFARTLEEAALAAVALSKGRKPGRAALPAPKPPAIKFKAGQRYIRGLYSGGTFCYEASYLLGDAWSNAPVDPARKMKDAWKSLGDTVVDLGDDVFTRGRPHPMIDHRLRNERLLAEAADPEVAVILFDVVLGYGSHPDPAAEMVPVLLKAKKNRSIAFVGSVCGTDQDPQGLERQETALRKAGVMLAESNARAVMLASALIKNI